MAKGQHLSRHQKKIVERYYEHRDTIMVGKLSEIVTELYLAGVEGAGRKKTDRLWDRAERALRQTDANRACADKVLAERDVKKLAELVNGLS